MPPALHKASSGFITENIKTSLDEAGRSTSSREYAAGDRGSARRRLASIIETTGFESAVGAVIMANLVCIILEADIRASCASLPDHEQSQCHRTWLTLAAVFFQAAYTSEALLRTFVHRCRAFADKWFLFDLFILSVGYIDLVSEMLRSSSFPGVQMLRIFRVGRLLRGVRLLREIPELHSMVAGFMSAMHAMFWGTLVILLLLMLFAILALEVINPISREIFSEEDWCHDAFTSVSMATLYFFQTLLGGDSWGICAIPLVRTNPWTFFIFAGALVCVQLGFTNLVLAVIVEKAAEISHQLQLGDVERIKQEKINQRTAAENAVHELCKQIDTDADGVVTCDELVNGFRDCAEVQYALGLLDIDTEDVSDLFHLMDADNSGELTYDEVTRCIHRADTQDMKRQIMFLKLQMKKIDVKLERILKKNMYASPIKPFPDGTTLQAVASTEPYSQYDQSAEQFSNKVQHIVHIQFKELRQRMDEDTQMLLKQIEKTCCSHGGRCEHDAHANSDGYLVQPDASWSVPRTTPASAQQGGYVFLENCCEIRSSRQNNSSFKVRPAL